MLLDSRSARLYFTETKYIHYDASRETQNWNDMQADRSGDAERRTCRLTRAIFFEF